MYEERRGINEKFMCETFELLYEVNVCGCEC